MTAQIREFALRLSTKNYVYSVLALSLAVGLAILNMPGGGGGGGGL